MFFSVHPHTGGAEWQQASLIFAEIENQLFWMEGAVLRLIDVFFTHDRKYYSIRRKIKT
jgi:hypothetical protein